MSLRRFLYGLTGCALLLLLWQLAGRTGALGKTLPAFTDVLAVYAQHYRRALLVRSAIATVTAATTGFALGSTAALLVALAAHLIPALRPGLDRLAVLVNALPIIALGPVLIITAGREGTPTALASIPVFFLIYMAVSSGLRSATPQLQLVFTTLGASPWQRLRRLEATAALPALLAGMKVAAGSAMIGAIVGEWFGAPTGLGIVVLNSMQNFQIPLMWATVLVIAAITLASYAILGLVEGAARRRIN
jgi:ABC-type nitrate/sulfonate/bicarbonate transport system permease component